MELCPGREGANLWIPGGSVSKRGDADAKASGWRAPGVFVATVAGVEWAGSQCQDLRGRGNGGHCSTLEAVLVEGSELRRHLC